MNVESNNDDALKASTKDEAIETSSGVEQASSNKGSNTRNKAMSKSDEVKVFGPKKLTTLLEIAKREREMKK